MTGQTYYFDRRGQWSGGGQALLNNAAHAEKRHPILQGGNNAIPIIPRNVPVKGARAARDFVLMPQNALAWSPRFRGFREFAFLAGLRISTEYYTRRANGIVRISGSVPALERPSVSPVIHNVLDTTFEEAVAKSIRLDVDDASGKIVCIGSGHSYKNLVNLIRGYEIYRESGGNLQLWIAGPPGSPRTRSDVERAASRVAGVTLTWRRVSREVCLAAFRSAAGVVFPSLVEASPVTVLEAAALNTNLIASDIIGHRGILGEYGNVPGRAFFDPTSDEAIAVALSNISSECALEPHRQLILPDIRESARVAWGDQIAGWVAALSGRGTVE